MSSIINKSQLRQFILDTIEVSRPALKGKMTRVSAEYLEQVEAATRASVRSHIDSMPSAGRTVR